VKRNCILGQSGMRDSDFSDNDFEEEAEEKKVDIDEENEEEEEEEEPKGNLEDEVDDLVKFVTIGSHIIKPNGIVLYRPTPVLPALPLQQNESDQKVKALNESEVKRSNQSHGDVNAKSGLNISKQDSEAENSTNCSSSSSYDTDANTEPVDSDAHMKSASLDFPISDREELPILEVVVGTARITQDSEKECCRSVFDEEAQETRNECYALVGASVDDKWEITRQKRVLSSNALSALNAEAGSNENSPKRKRGLEQSFKGFCPIPEIALGIDALDQIIQPLPRQYVIRDDLPLISSSSDKEEDEMLSEELEERFQNSGMGYNGGNSIIPLLTPPQSPRTVDGNLEGQVMVAIEWPSNLVMDIAIMRACTNLSSVSTCSNNGDNLMNDYPKILTSGEPSSSGSATRLRTISVATT